MKHEIFFEFPSTSADVLPPTLYCMASFPANGIDWRAEGRYLRLPVRSTETQVLSGSAASGSQSENSTGSLSTAVFFPHDGDNDVWRSPHFLL